MGKIFINQSKLRLQLNLGIALASGDVPTIRYRKPNSTTIEELTEVEILSEADGSIYYDFTDGELDVAGVWTFWAYVVFDDGRVAPGEVASVKVYTEGTN